ncbi:MAG: SEL1-like repeat protein [Deferribacteraceae bacterium]|jgi:TPR repeat protein|nr:SEL1-like repeat protein [Deferribacteraceae bacterium]
MHRLGLGVPKDYAKAAEWYIKAANKGYVNAQNNLKALYNQ